MKKQIFLFAVAALALASCSSENDVVQTPNVVEQTADDGAVVFDSYVNRATTRAGQAGTLTTELLKNSSSDLAASNGFGVFGFYTNNVPYGETSIPDFFYNQKVYYESNAWKYEPVKFWPNEFGTDAQSTGQDKLTFFAYAPYVPVTPSTGRLTDKAGEKSGIVGMTSNTATGDPYVKYIVDFDPENRVDLCFGVANSDFTSSVDDANSPNNIKAGTPFIDVIKPKTTDKIFFNFKHALASLNVQIDADIDELSHGANPYPADGKTKIYVRKVTFEGFAEKGQLNLNSEAKTVDYDPNWYEMTSMNARLSSGSVTIYDGRRDGKEGQANADASNENPKALNPTIIQNETSTDGVPATTKVNLFDSTEPTAPIFVIPTDEDLTVTIVYDVETEDPNLATYLSDGKTKGSTIENTITKDIKLSGAPLNLKAGKAYQVSLHLGMTSVKFDAAVTDWVNVSNADVDLPINAVAGGSSNAILSASETAGSYTISGLTDGNTLEVNVIDATFASGITVTTSTIAGGNSTVNYTFSAANTTVKDKKGAIIVTEKDGSGNIISVTTLNVTQKAVPLGLSVSNINGTGDKDINLASTAAGINWADVVADGEHVKVTKNGTALQYGSTGDGKYTYSTGKITLIDAPAANDVYIITVQAGDAAAEVTTAKIGAISYATSTITLGVGNTYTNPLTITGTGTVTYGSNDTDKATVNSTGLVTGVAAGSATITATVANDAVNGWFYLSPKTATYTVNVKAVGTISYAEATVNVLANAAPAIPQALVKTGDGTVSYESSNTAIATVASDGTVTINKAGTVTITATVTDGTNNTYPVKKASYTLVITKANAAISFDVLSETTSVASYTKEVVKDPTAADGTITYTSSNTSVATVNASGVVSKVAPGTVTITAKATDGDKYHYIVDTASYELTFK